MPFYSTPKGSSPVLAGSGAPASGLGNVGDIYVDTVAKELYGPKTSAGWGAAVSLQGPAGPQGPQGPAGAAGSGAVSSVAGRSGDVTLTKTDVGLANVDNTSDASKPVSTATQSALDGKANTSHAHGAVTADGRIGSASGKVITTTTGGALQASDSIPSSSISGLRGQAISVVVGRGNADFVCTGTSGSATDHATIQAAIDSIAATGGAVYIREGTYYLGATINITAPNIEIIGAGRATQLRAMTDYGNVFLCNLTPTPTAWPGLSGLAFRSLRFETAVNRTTGAAIRANYTHDAQFHDLYICDTTYGISFGIGSPSSHFWDGIYLQAQDQCDIANVTAQCKRYSVYMSGSGYASADFSYDGIVRDCDFYGVPDEETRYGTGVFVGPNSGGVVISNVSMNQLEYAVYADATVVTSPAQGGGIISINGGYEENTGGLYIKQYQNVWVSNLWGKLTVEATSPWPGFPYCYVTIMGIQGSPSAGDVVLNGEVRAQIYSSEFSFNRNVTGTAANSTNVTFVDNAWANIKNRPNVFTPASHAHGNLTSLGRLGTVADRVAVTTTDGALTTAAIGSGLTLSGGTLTASGGGSPAWADITSKPTTVSGFGITDAVTTSDARLTDSREWSASTVTQADAEAGTATARVAWTVQRVWQALAAWWAASAMKTKLDGIAVGATANATDAQLRDRSTHTGSQAISTVTGLQTALDGKAASSHAASHGVGGADPVSLLATQVETGADTDYFNADESVQTALTELSTAVSGKAATSHAHGNLTSDGKVGSTADRLVVTGAAGAITTATIGSGLSLSGGTLTASGGGGGSSYGNNLLFG